MEHSPNLTYYVIHLCVSGLSLLITSKIISGFRVSNFISAVLAAVVIGVANAIIWPVLIFLTLPINILTLGLFTFVVNGAILKISAALLPGFAIETWWAAIFGSIVLSLVSTVLHYFLL